MGRLPDGLCPSMRQASSPCREAQPALVPGRQARSGRPPRLPWLLMNWTSRSPGLRSSNPRNGIAGRDAADVGLVDINHKRLMSLTLTLNHYIKPSS